MKHDSKLVVKAGKALADSFHPGRGEWDELSEKSRAKWERHATAVLDTVITELFSGRTLLAELAKDTLTAADGDSNDAEIESLQDFRDEALRVLAIEVSEE